MFTGIIQGIAKIFSIKEKKNLKSYTFIFPKNILSGLKIGASVSNNGCCLTVVNIKKNLVTFDLIEETLKTTNFNELNIGCKINVERALTLRDEIGGHIMSGHIITMGIICKIIILNNKHVIWFKIKNIYFMRFIFPKGFIGIDGISLTVGVIKKNKFCVYLVPKTLSLTTLGTKKLGDKVNIEIDSKIQAIVNSVEQFIKNYLLKNKI